MTALHLTQAKKIMDDKKTPFSVDVWEISTGNVLHYDEVVCIKYDFYSGTRTVKFLRSHEIRTIRDICVKQINGYTVYV